MELLRKLNKPDFYNEMQGGWFLPDVLAMEVKVRLWKQLPRRMTHAQKVHFLYRVGESIQVVEMCKNNTPPADQVKQIELVQARARALLQALAALSSDSGKTLKAHAEFLAIGPNPPHQLSASARFAVLSPDGLLLGNWWDQAQDIETAAAYAASQVTPAKTTRPKQHNAKRLVFMAAQDFHKVMGRLPPCSKGAWFLSFANELGKSVKLSIGAALAVSVVKEMADSKRFPLAADLAKAPARMHFFFVAPDKPPD